MDKAVIQAIKSTRNIDELVTQFEALLKVDLSNTPTGKKRIAANQKAKDILAKYNGDYSNVSPEDKAALRDYTGFGGIGGSTNEYYTPKWVAEAVWESLRSYGFDGGSVLEPSAGVGVFSETKPANALNTSVEMDPTSAAINQILHQDDHVINSGFEAVANDPSVGDFDAVIGNPPYGVRDASANDDREYKNIKYADQYFVTRSIDKARAGGLIALVLPTRIVESGNLKKWRTSLALKAEFLGAHRLPTGTFADTGVVTDLVIWRKHSEAGQELIDNASKEALEQSGVLWDTWLTGKWFKREGKKFINGEESTQGAGKFARKVVDRGNRSNMDIKEALTRRFDSHIDWALLDSNVEPPASTKYDDGDTIFRNGIQFEMQNGEWIESENNAKRGNVDKSTYGVTHSDDLQAATYSIDSMMNLTASQAIKAYEDFPYLCHDDFKAIVRSIIKLPQGQQELAYKGVLLGRKVKTLSTMVAGGRSRSKTELLHAAVDSEEQSIADYRTRLGGQITELNALMGNSHISQKELAKLDESFISDWHSYKSSIDNSGQLSDLLTGELRVEHTNQYNSSRMADVLHFCERELGHTSLTLDEIRVYYTAPDIANLSDDQLLDKLALMDEVAINNDGSIQAMHRACSGHVGRRIEALQNQLAVATSDNVKANYMRQIETIDAKRKKISLDEVKVKLTDNWIPRHIMLEFLQDAGYADFELGEWEENEFTYTDNDGEEKIGVERQFVQSETGTQFSGYRWRDGKKRNASDEAFERQIESYINEGKVRGGGDNAEKSLVRSKIRSIDDEFTNWLAASDHSDELEEQYNNTFNNWIKPEFDGGDLGLEGVSGAIEFMPYQNSTIRRHSADGNGILALGTGLGKTLTGLGLIQHNLLTKRASRVGVVVPKSTLENWFYESDLFFGEQNLSDKIFVGLEVAKDKNGKIERETVLDENGDPRLDKKGEPIKRAKLKVVTNGKKIAEQLHAVTQSTARIVVMTKDVYGRIPMKPETISENVMEMKEAGLIAGSHKLVKDAQNHRDKEKNARFENKFSDDGTAKNETLPYFEDLLFDSVMVDEAHDFRNSYKGGSYRNNLAFLPSQAQANRAIDMQLKNNLVKARNDGNGIYFLTATPTVNSPVDMFNMLSHIVPAETFAKMGIFDSDDFIRMFGKTGEALVTKLSGEVESKEALLGFQNLDALRNIVNRYMTMEDAKSVGAEVHIPDLIAATSKVQMNDEQEALYEELRHRADAISNPDEPENQEIVEQYPNDTVFGLIRKMDKVSTDLDLYHERVTYRFSKAKVNDVQAALDALPSTVTILVEEVTDSGEVKFKKKAVKLEKEIVVEGKHAIVRLRQEFADQFVDMLDKGKIKYSHPVSPKYAKFLDKAKEVYMAGGKQLVFSEEKSQHKKLAKIIADHTGCKMSEIGILNSDTVAGKKGSKASEDDQEAGLEAMAKSYNTSKYKFMILNKKGEVGINLHHGTTDIHHLTLPWTPMSITQRNGRGARVGSKQASVNVHYYTSKGSFDDFRLATITRKANWIETMFKGDEKFVANADADSSGETAIMLAADPEEAKRRIEASKREAERKQKAEKVRQTSISMNKFIHATNQLNVDLDEIGNEITELESKLEEQAEKVEKARANADGAKSNSYEYRQYTRAKSDHLETQKRLTTLNRARDNQKKAANTLKKLTPSIQKEINEGNLKDYPDFLTHPELYLVKNGKIVRQGYTYKVKTKERSWDLDYVNDGIMTIQKVDRKSGTVNGLLVEENGKEVSRGNNAHPIEQVFELANVDQSRAELEAKALTGVSLADTCKTFDRETYFELVEAGKIKRYGFESNCLIKTADGYKTPYGFKHSAEEPLVYPDATDKAVFKGLLAQIVNELETKGRVQLSSSILTHFLGRNWEEMAKEQGKKADEQDVIERITLEIKKFETDNQTLYNQALLKAESTYHGSIEFFKALEKYIDDLNWKGYVNRTEISTFKRRQMTRYGETLKERSAQHIAEQEHLLFSNFTKLVGSDPTRPKRLAEIAKAMKKYKPTSDHHLIKVVDSLYSGDVQEAMLQVCADLHAIGYKSFDSGDGLLVAESWDFTRAKGNFGSMFMGYGSGGIDRQTFIDKYLTAEAMKPTPVVVTEKQAEKLENIDGFDAGSVDTFAEAVSQLGIEVKTLTQDIPKWSFQRNGRGKRYGGQPMEAFKFIGLMSNERGGGPLKELLAGNRSLKAELDAKFIPAGAFAEYGFDGGWWFINASSDLANLADQLFDTAGVSKVA